MGLETAETFSYSGQTPSTMRGGHEDAHNSRPVHFHNVLDASGTGEQGADDRQDAGAEHRE